MVDDGKDILSVRLRQGQGHPTVSRNSETGRRLEQLQGLLVLVTGELPGE